MTTLVIPGPGVPQRLSPERGVQPSNEPELLRLGSSAELLRLLLTLLALTTRVVAVRICLQVLVGAARRARVVAKGLEGKGNDRDA